VINEYNGVPCGPGFRHSLPPLKRFTYRSFAWRRAQTMAQTLTHRMVKWALKEFNERYGAVSVPNKGLYENQIHSLKP